jgi:mannose/cellobiose epimerase-like protein (N-acyl-D-glucosamine 2-epimerase family)
MSPQPPDLVPWFRQHLLEDILPHWLAAAPMPSGFFHPSLDRAWNRVAPAHTSLVSQSRLLYVFSVGWRLTGDGRFRDAVAAGVQFLTTHMRDPEWPGWFYSVDESGAVVDDRKDAYGHAFVIFGLSHAARTLEDDSVYQLARETLALVRTEFMDGYGGLVPSLTRGLVSAADGRTQNPVMHLFEAHLALLECEWTKRVASSAQEFGRFIVSLMDTSCPGRLPELYNENWRPLDRQHRGRVDLGHACEWAFLFSRAAQMGLGDEWFDPAQALLAHGLEVGEAPDGGLYSNELPEGGVLAPERTYWQQCELLRSLVHFAATRGREDLWEKAARHLAYVRTAFVDPEYGGWYSTPAVDGNPPERCGKGNIWKVDYHVTGMCEEALRVL